MATVLPAKIRSTLLPRPASTFFGREAELSSLWRSLAEAPLATIVGLGGVGKTRVALRFAERHRAEFPDGITFIDCDRYDGRESLARAILGQIEGETTAGDAVVELGARSRNLRNLVILDGAERYSESVAALMAALVAGSPSSRFIVTSREPLKIMGEQLVPLVGLPEATAVELFTDRMSLGNVRVALTKANRERITSICRRLDGIALAVELAAAWTSVMSLDAIEARLSDRYRFLARGASRVAPERHQSLKAVVDGSYAALSDPQRVLFRRLAIFASTFSLDAVLGVCVDGTDEPALVDDLAVLIDKSLVVSEHVGEATQYRLLHTLREYGIQLLRDGGEEDALIRRLDRWCVSQANDPDVARLLPNIEDFRGAARRALADPARADEAATLLGMSRGLWYAAAEWHFVRASLLELVNARNGLADEARGNLWLAIAAYGEVCRQSIDEELAAVEQAATLLTAGADARTNIKLLHARARVRMRSGDLAGARAAALQCIEESRVHGDRHQEAAALRLLAYERFFQNDYPAAESAMLGALEAFREVNAVAFESSARISLAEIQFARGDAHAAIRSVEAARSSPTPLSHYYLSNFAIYLLAVGRAEEARAIAAEAIDVCRAINDRVLMLGGILALAACCASTEPATCVQLMRYVEAQRHASNRRNGPTEHFALQKVRDDAEQLLGTEELERNLALDGTLSTEQADARIDALRARFPAPASPPSTAAAPIADARRTADLSTLSAREWTIAVRVAQGLTNGAIAEQLFLSRRTVEAHVATILRKTDLQSRVQLAARIVSLHPRE